MPLKGHTGYVTDKAFCLTAGREQNCPLLQGLHWTAKKYRKGTTWYALSLTNRSTVTCAVRLTVNQDNAHGRKRHIMQQNDAFPTVREREPVMRQTV